MKLEYCKTITSIMFVLFVAWPVTAFAVEVESDMPDFLVVTLDGQEIKTSDIKGKGPLMMVFWATWCPNCKKEIPQINALFSEFSPKGMQFMGINVGVNDSAAKAARYVKKFKIGYPIIFDEGSKLTQKFSVQGTPTIIIVDRHGVVKYRDAVVPEDLRDHYKQLMM